MPVFSGTSHSSSSAPELTLSLLVLRRSCQSRILRDSPSSCDSAAKRSAGNSGPRARAYASARAERDELALRLVSQGLGIAIAPLSLAANDVVARSMQGLDAKRSIGLKWRTEVPDDILATVLDAISNVRRDNNAGCLPAHMSD